MPELSNLRREMFCRYFMKTGNRTASAKAAGYAPAGARQYGSYLLTNRDIKQRLDDLKREALEDRDLTPELVKKMLLKGYFESEHPRDKKGFADSLARVLGMFTDNVNQGSQRDAVAVIEALKGHLPEEVLQGLAKRFNVPLEAKEATHDAPDAVN